MPPSATPSTTTTPPHPLSGMSELDRGNIRAGPGCRMSPSATPSTDHPSLSLSPVWNVGAGPEMSDVPLCLPSPPPTPSPHHSYHLSGMSELLLDSTFLFKSTLLFFCLVLAVAFSVLSFFCCPRREAGDVKYSLPSPPNPPLPSSPSSGISGLSFFYLVLLFLGLVTFLLVVHPPDLLGLFYSLCRLSSIVLVKRMELLLSS